MSEENNKKNAAAVIALTGTILAEQIKSLSERVAKGIADGQDKEAALELLKTADVVGLLSSKMVEVASLTCQHAAAALLTGPADIKHITEVLDANAKPIVTLLANTAEGVAGN